MMIGVDEMALTVTPKRGPLSGLPPDTFVSGVAQASAVSMPSGVMGA